MGKRRNIDWDAVPLGEHTDLEIAEMLGCSHTSVRAARLNRGIANPNRRRERSIDARVLAVLSDGQCHSVSELCDQLGKAANQMRLKLWQLVADGKIERHAIGGVTRFVYSLPGVTYRRKSPLNGTAKASIKANEREQIAESQRQRSVACTQQHIQHRR